MSTAIIKSLFLKSEKFFLFVSFRETQHRALVKIIANLIFLVSRRLAEKRPKESRSFVCPYVRHAVSRKPFITLQLGGTWIGDKNVPSAFLKNS